MRSYLEMLTAILEGGTIRTDRTGVGTIGIFGYQWRHNLALGFPLLTTKKMSFRIVVAELLWMLSGSTNIRQLQAQGVHIWDEWADDNGELGPIYGKQWRHWEAMSKDGLVHVVDQIGALVQGLKSSPDSRRHVVTAWNPADVPDMKLPPCHFAFQCYVNKGANDPKPKLSLMMTMRSADVFLGVPYNIAFYALLTHLLAEVCGYDVGELIVSFGDLHIYRNHEAQVFEQLQRNPRALPKLVIGGTIDDIFAVPPALIQLEGYDSHPAIKAPVAV